MCFKHSRPLAEDAVRRVRDFASKLARGRERAAGGGVTFDAYPEVVLDASSPRMPAVASAVHAGDVGLPAAAD